MRKFLVATLLLPITLGSIHGQIPDLPTLGENWVDLAYPKVYYTPRDGLTAGLFYSQVRPPGYRDWFDPQPYRASLALDGQISTSGSHKLQLYARMPNLVPGWRFSLVAESRRRARQNYFGVGNDTDWDGDNVTPAQPNYYRADHHRMYVRGEIQRRVVSHLRVLAGFHAERWKFDTLSGVTLLGLDSDDDLDLTVDRFTGDVTARVGLVFDTRNDELAPLHGVLLQAIVGFADSTVAGAVSYRRTTLSAAGYWTLGEKYTFAGRVLAQTMSGSPGLGSYPLLESTDVPIEGFGGPDSHRGVADFRYWGEDKILASLETRYQVVGERGVLAAHLLGFVDAGRVFQPGEDDFSIALDGMHVGVGGGPVLSFGRQAVLGTTLALGPDGLTWQLMTHWAF